MKIKIIKKLLSILLYVGLIAGLMGFDFIKLFDGKQIFLLLCGTVLLYLPNMSKNFREIDWNVFGRIGMIAGLTETFVMLFISLSEIKDREQVAYHFALSSRPILYGFIIWVIFNDFVPSRVRNEKTSGRTELTMENCYIVLQEMGLTKRETEVAVCVACKGYSNAEIAAELSVSETTLKKHLSNIFQKLEIGKREEILKKILEVSKDA